MIERCACAICASRQARGEPAFAGISISSAAHVVAPTERLITKELLPAPVVTLQTIRAEIKAFADGVLSEGIGRAIGEIMRESEQRCAALEAKINGLQAAMAQFRYKGTWDEKERYQAGNFVSQGGAVYHCNADNTSTRPGADSNSWSLVCARGRDGRDAVAPEPAQQRTVRTHR